MKKRVSLLVAASLLAAPAVLAQQPAPAPYKQDGSWSVDYGDDYCRLAGNFTNGRDQIALAIERTAPGPTMRLILVGSGFKFFRSANEIGYRFLPSGKARETMFWRSKTADGKDFVNFGSMIMLGEFTPSAPGTPPAPPPPYSRDTEQATARTISGILVDRGLTESVQIDTGPLGAPLKALQACADDLLKTWGLDPEKHRALTRPAMPAGPTSGWIPQGTIPFSEFGKLGGGANSLRLLVDASGKATACHVTWPALDKGLNDRICAAAMDKGKFMPALDKDGQAMASYWVTDVFWLLPGPGGRRG